NMSTIKYLSPVILKSWFDSFPEVLATRTNSVPSPGQKFVIIDVRDDDHLGPHIPTSLNIPSSTFLASMPKLSQDLKNYDCVVFYCMMSQIRGPSAARAYARWTQEGSDIAPEDQQKIYILEGGFENWERLNGGVGSIYIAQS
ncbi:Rhodanese-like protein, partial [Nadsonia fulvescens var. elongata DSM 6958]